MSVEMAAFGVGRSVAQLAAGRLLAGRSMKADAGKDLVELIRIGVPDEIKRRRVQRQFEDIADSVAERLLTFAKNEYRGLTDGDREAVLHQVVLTLERADLSDEAFFAADADPVKLARGLRSRLPARKAEFELGDAGARLYDVVLDECCDCLARIVIHLPQFEPRASVETLSRLTELAGQVNAVLARLPVRTLTAPEGESEDDEFTRRYLAWISESLDTLELFGVRFERFTRPQTTLSVAYISLNVSEDGRLERRPTRPEAIPVNDWREASSGSVRVEWALSNFPWMLLRGEAGSGKSTLLRWLAVTAARGAFTGPLESWNGHVPFIVKLRSHAGGPLPRPEEFLDDVAGNLAGLMPRGWVHRRLMSGDAVLLVDGVDEVTASQRQAVRRWLGGIAREFPDVRVIVTSRPAAAEADWLQAEGFATAFLEQLTPPDISALIRHWHNAVRDCADLPVAPERLPAYEAKLLGRLEAAPHLRSLASSPLLAAMLCALNLDREALPRSRMGLYGAALDMLLEGRDTKRGIPSVLERDQKVRILQAIAWHLSASSRVELPKPMVERLVAERLASMPQIQVSAREVLDELLHRSGVIREPVPGRIDFVHRTVQEYLTAKHAADLGDMDLLVQNAHRDTWRETVIMAAGHANDPLRRELVTGILARMWAEPRRARLLKLLAVSCLETLPSVPEDIRSELDRCLDDLVPPRNMRAARSLAAVGEHILAHLPRSLDGLPAGAARACVRTACMVNGPDALDVLARYAPDPRQAIREELYNAWQYFDADQYARRVLSALPVGAALHVHGSSEQLAALTHVPPLSYLSIWTYEGEDVRFVSAQASTLKELSILGGVNDVASLLPPLPEIRRLTLQMTGAQSLAFLDEMPELESVWLINCADIQDFTPLRRHRELVGLSVQGGVHLTTLEHLPPLHNVTGLGLSATRLRCDPAELVEAAPNATSLLLNACSWVDDLVPLTRLPLTDLRLGGCRNIDDFSPLSAMKNLTILYLDGTWVRDLVPLSGLGGLEELYLSHCRGIADLSPLAALPRLKLLDLRNAGRRLDLSPLAGNRKLIVEVDHRQDVRGAEALGERLKKV